MGFITTIVIHNDALGEFDKHPKEFGEAILDAISDFNHEPKTVPFFGAANHIKVFPSRHADSEILYLHKGNTVTEIDESSREFLGLIERLPQVAKDFVQSAERILKYAKRKL